MADNRMYLLCKACGEAFFMGKRMGGGYYIGDYHEKALRERLNAFYDKHEWCDGSDSLDCFEIVYEMDDDFEEKVTGFFYD